MAWGTHRGNGCSNMNHFKAVYKTMQRHSQGHRSHEAARQCARSSRMRSLDSVNIRYLNFDNVKIVIFTKTVFSTSQTR